MCEQDTRNLERKRDRNSTPSEPGAYSAGRLPWESQEAYDKHCAAFVNLYQPAGYIEHDLLRDMAANRWQRKRSNYMTAVAMHRHEFGQALVESGAKSWQEVRTFVCQSDIANKETLERIAASMVRAIELGVQIKEKSYNSDEVSKVVHEMADTWNNTYTLLEGVDRKLDLDREFFEHYMPEKLEQIIRVQNARDAQFDKMHSRLQVIQEARLRREALSLSKQQAAVVNLLFDKPAAQEVAEQDSASHDRGTESNALHRDKTHQRSGDGGDRPWRQPARDVDLDADDSPSGEDPLAEFVEESDEN